jgi:hypothetical protein
VAAAVARISPLGCVGEGDADGAGHGAGFAAGSGLGGWGRLYVAIHACADEPTTDDRRADHRARDERAGHGSRIELADRGVTGAVIHRGISDQRTWRCVARGLANCRPGRRHSSGGS